MAIVTRHFTAIVALSVAALMLLWWAGAIGAEAGKPQACDGVLTRDDEGFLLKPDPGSTLWCDAYIGDIFHIGDASVVQRVFKACQVGSRCHIEGSFVGHGVFYWKHVSRAWKTE